MPGDALAGHSPPGEVLLKNTIQARIGARPCLFLTDAAANGLGLPGVGVEHREDYPDVGPIGGRIVELGEG